MRLSTAFCLLATLALVNFSIAGADAKRLDSKEPTPPSKRKTDKNLWIVSQQTDGSRSYTLCLGEGAVKFVVGDIVLMARKPDWQVAVMNEKNKLFCRMPLAEFHGLPTVEQFDVKALASASSADEKESINKHSVERFEGKPEYSDEKAKKLGFVPAKMIVWTCSDVKADDQALEVLSRIYGLGGLKGVPMRVKMVTEKGEEIAVLNTSWCFDRELAPLFFDVPKRFRPGKDLAEVQDAIRVGTLRSQLKKGATSQHVKSAIKSHGAKNAANADSKDKH